MNSKSENATPDDELLTAYLDGELDEGERTAVESRLADDELLLLPGCLFVQQT